jgi:hypothetical protein
MLSFIFRNFKNLVFNQPAAALVVQLNICTDITKALSYFPTCQASQGKKLELKLKDIKLRLHLIFSCNKC